MIAQWFLSAALLLVALYALSQWRVAPLVAGSILCTALAGALVVTFPELATRTAHVLGIGRGADLIMYVFIVVILAAILNIHIKLRANNRQLTELARSIALQSARIPKKDQ